MKVIVCIDQNKGIAFHHRRQSRDVRLCEYLLQMAGTQTLWISPYSQTLFASNHLPMEGIRVSECYLEEAGEEDYCFVELDEIGPFSDRISHLIVCHWNRDYPADQFLDLCFSDWERTDTVELVGKSHPSITIDFYKK